MASPAIDGDAKPYRLDVMLHTDATKMISAPNRSCKGENRVSLMFVIRVCLLILKLSF